MGLEFHTVSVYFHRLIDEFVNIFFQFDILDMYILR